MFAAIAGRYDLNNRLHSFGRDQAWRRAAVRAAGVRPGDTVVDVACGTGDLSLLFARAGAKVVGVDFTVPMLEVAQGKGGRVASSSGAGAGGPTVFTGGDAMRLPVDDAVADAVSIAFGIRNVTDPAAALREFRRVLRPGGRLVVLEFATPRNPLVRMVNAVYCQRVMPVTAAWIAGDRSGAYRYLPRSVGTFLTPDQMRDSIAAAGFGAVTATPLTFGVAMIYRGVAR